MTDICLVFEVHQPLRLNRNFHHDLLAKPSISKRDLFELYFDNTLNKHIFDRAARKCYLPANRIILEQINNLKGQSRSFKVAFGLSGVFIEQCAKWNQDLLDSFKELAQTGCVEFLEETYYHSLASLFGTDQTEFIEQVNMHRHLMKELFDSEPKIFENTECLYNNAIARTIAGLGYKGIITEGVERVLDWRSPNYVYKAKGASISVLLRNYRLADDIGFRFSSTWWSQWPLTAKKYASWLAAMPGQAVTLFMDYETFGEHHWPETGIHEFLRWLPREVLNWNHLNWRTPSEVVKRHQPVGEFDVHEFNTVSWADLERDPSAWISNPMQKVSYELQKGLEPLVKDLRDKDWLRLWRYIQLSDHLYYMSIKGGGPGDVHAYFNPSGNPIDAFVTYSNIISDLEARILQELQKPEQAAKWILRRLPSDKGFTFFHEFARPTKTTPCSLSEFATALRHVSIRSLNYHLERGDFETWLSQVLGDKKLAEKVNSIASERLRTPDLIRKKIVALVEARVKQLESISAQKEGDR